MIKSGDKNTKFSHKIATAHRRLNTIDSLMINGEQSHDPVAIKYAIAAFYQNLYKEDQGWRPNPNILDVRGITIEEQEVLERAFEEEEVLEEIKMCAADKAPWAKWDTMAFFQAFWDTIKKI